MHLLIQYKFNVLICIMSPIKPNIKRMYKKHPAPIFNR